jgi:hypothetical protein
MKPLKLTPLLALLCSALAYATAPTITTTALPAGAIGTPYSTQIISAGGGPINTWALSGNLPSGLIFNTASAFITGTPAVAGSFPLQIKVTDSAGDPPANATFTLVIAGAGTGTGTGYTATLSWTPGANPGGDPLTYSVWYMVQQGATPCTTAGMAQVATGLTATTWTQPASTISAGEVECFALTESAGGQTSGYSNIVTGAPNLPPGAPSSITITFTPAPVAN